MRAAYIGILTPGSTSRMRAEWLRKLTPDWEWDWVDTDQPMIRKSRVAQSLAYRFKTGPAVSAINNAVERWAVSHSVDLAWVDKAIFLRPSTVRALRTKSRRVIHFTPDTAFHANRSRHFNATLKLFDLLVTTKSFENDEYAQRGVRKKVCLTTQGFDPDVHQPRSTISERCKNVAFIGLAEPSREKFISELLDRGIAVRLAGAGWRQFVRRRQSVALLHFEGEGAYGDAYAEFFSRSWIGLGLVSKRFPELHTTRTFEIPACGAILASERNSETTKFFQEEEALFFEDARDLAERIRALFASPSDIRLASFAERGRERVLRDGRDYPSILSRILNDPRAG